MSGPDYGVDMEAEWALAQVERTRRENALNAAESVSVAPAAEESASDPREAVSVDVRGQESPAERLRTAADLLEQRAAAATPGPWQPEHAYDGSRVQAVYVDCPAEDGCDGVDCYDDTHGIGGFETDGDNRWAILANPDIGPPLAAWLRSTAACADRLAFGHLACDEPLALADVILGGAS